MQTVPYRFHIGSIANHEAVPLATALRNWLVLQPTCAARAAKPPAEVVPRFSMKNRVSYILCTVNIVLHADLEKHNHKHIPSVHRWDLLSAIFCADVGPAVPLCLGTLLWATLRTLGP